MEDREMIYRKDARAAVLQVAPEAAFCIDRVKKVDAVEVVHAEWVWKDGCFHCTNCKQTEDHITKYCPGCGAKMDGGENGE